MRPGPIARMLTAPILGYQRWISPGFPATCRFSPTCSAYALEALRTRGALVGLALALWRVLRCHPFSPGGHDPVPHRRNRSPAPSVECSTPHSGVSR